MTKTSTRSFATIKAAADAGNPDAQAALTALEEAADAIEHHTRSGAEYGLAEARRRFGPRPGDAA